MAKKARAPQRREDALSRERIVEASIELLDSHGEAGLTFRALSERLATGPGAIYWHITGKDELLAIACDAVVARAMNAPLADATPEATIRAIALRIFDAIHAHPWIGSELSRASGDLPIVRILERIGQEVRALGVREEEQWATVSALLSYIVGVGRQNAANARFAQSRGLQRTDFLASISSAWSELDPDEYPFARSVAGKLGGHDDRADFLTGIDLILRGLDSPKHRPASN